MKKIIIAVFITIISFGVFTLPKNIVSAEETQFSPEFNTYYSHEQNKYVDLNNVNNFVVNENKFYYSKLVRTEGLTSYYGVYLYDNNTNTLTQLTSDANPLRNVSSMQLANNYLYIGYDHNSYKLIDTNTINETNYTSHLLDIFSNEPFSIFFDGEKYITATIESSVNPVANTLKVAYFTDIADPTSMIGDIKTFDLSAISGNIDNTFSLEIGLNKIYIIKENTLYLFNYDVNGISFSSPITKPLFTDIKDFTIYSSNSKNYFVFSRTEAIYFYNIDEDDAKVKTFDESGYNESSIYISKNMLYLQNNTTCDLKKYTIDLENEKTLNDETVVLKGKGSETGRFDGVNDFALKCNEYIFVSDKNNSRIQILKQDEETQVIDLKDEHNDFYAKALMLATDNTLYYLKTDGVVSYLCGVNIFKNTSITPIELNYHISDACICNKGIIYMLDTANRKIVSFDTNNNFTKNELQLNTLSLDSSSRIQHLDQYLIISSGEKLYKYSTNTFTLDPSHITFDNPIVSFTCPINQLIYVSCEGENKVHRVSFESNNVNAEINWQNSQNVSLISTNPQDGSIFGFDENTSSIVYFKEQEFCYGYDTVEPFQKYVLSSLNGYTSIVNYGVLKANNFVYEYTNYVGNHDIFTSDKYVIVLDTKITTNQFTYVLYVVNNEVKLGYVETSALDIYTIENQSNKYSLITTDTNTPIYKFPTIKGNLEVETVENIGTVLISEGAYPVSIDGLDTKYYIVKLINNTYGFVPSTYTTQNVNIAEKFSSNATIKIYDYSDFVNIYSNTDKEEIIGALNNDQRVYVEKYDKNAEFTLIKYLDGDNKIRAGYIDTKYISMDGASPLITTAIILFATTLLIIIALVVWYITFKKKQNQDTMREKDKEIENKKIKNTKSSKDVSEENNTDKE